MALSELVKRSIGIIGGSIKDSTSNYFSNTADFINDVKTIGQATIGGTKTAKDHFDKMRKTGIGKKIRDWFYQSSADFDDFNFEDDEFDPGFKVGSSEDAKEESNALDKKAMTNIAKSQTGVMYKIAAKNADMGMANTAEIISAINSRSTEVTASINNLNRTLIDISKKLDNVISITSSANGGSNSSGYGNKPKEPNNIFGYDGGVTLGNMGSTIKEQFSESSLMQYAEIIKNMIQSGGVTPEYLFSNLVISPLLQTKIKKFGNKSIDDIGEGFNDIVGAYINTVLTNTIKRMTSTSLIGEIFENIEQGPYGKNRNFQVSAKNVYNEKPVSFDGATRQSIIHVIPQYLNEILKVVSGGPGLNIDTKGHLTTKPKKQLEDNFELKVEKTMFSSINIDFESRDDLRRHARAYDPKIGSGAIVDVSRFLSSAFLYFMYKNGIQLLSQADISLTSPMSIAAMRDAAMMLANSSGKSVDYWMPLLEHQIAYLESKPVKKDNWIRELQKRYQKMHKELDEWARNSPFSDQARVIDASVLENAADKAWREFHQGRSARVRPTNNTNNNNNSNNNNGDDGQQSQSGGQTPSPNPAPSSDGGVSVQPSPITSLGIGQSSKYLEGIFALLNRGVNVYVMNPPGKKNHMKKPFSPIPISSVVNGIITQSQLAASSDTSTDEGGNNNVSSGSDSSGSSVSSGNTIIAGSDNAVATAITANTDEDEYVYSGGDDDFVDEEKDKKAPEIHKEDLVQVGKILRNEVKNTFDRFIAPGSLPRILLHNARVSEPGQFIQSKIETGADKILGEKKRDDQGNVIKDEYGLTVREGGILSTAREKISSAKDKVKHDTDIMMFDHQRKGHENFISQVSNERYEEGSEAKEDQNRVMQINSMVQMAIQDGKASSDEVQRVNRMVNRVKSPKLRRELRMFTIPMLKGMGKESVQQHLEDEKNGNKKEPGLFGIMLYAGKRLLQTIMKPIKFLGRMIFKFTKKLTGFIFKVFKSGLKDVFGGLKSLGSALLGKHGILRLPFQIGRVLIGGPYKALNKIAKNIGFLDLGKRWMSGKSFGRSFYEVKRNQLEAQQQKAQVDGKIDKSDKLGNKIKKLDERRERTEKFGLTVERLGKMASLGISDMIALNKWRKDQKNPSKNNDKDQKKADKKLDKVLKKHYGLTEQQMNDEEYMRTLRNQYRRDLGDTWNNMNQEDSKIKKGLKKLGNGIINSAAVSGVYEGFFGREIGKLEKPKEKEPVTRSDEEMIKLNNAIYGSGKETIFGKIHDVLFTLGESVIQHFKKEDEQQTGENDTGNNNGNDDENKNKTDGETGISTSNTSEQSSSTSENGNENGNTDNTQQSSSTSSSSGNEQQQSVQVQSAPTQGSGVGTSSQTSTSGTSTGGSEATSGSGESGEGGGGKLKGAIGAIHGVIKNIFKVFGSTAKIVVGLGKMLASIVMGMSAFKAIGNTVTKILTKSLKPLNSGLRAIKKAITPVIKQLGVFVKDLSQMLSDIVGSLIDTIMPIITDVISPIMKALSPVITMMLSSGLENLMGMLDMLITDILAPILGVLMNKILPIIRIMGDAMQVLTGLGQVLLGVVQKSVGVIIQAIGGVISLFSKGSGQPILDAGVAMSEKGTTTIESGFSSIASGVKFMGADALSIIKTPKQDDEEIPNIDYDKNTYDKTKDTEFSGGSAMDGVLANGDINSNNTSNQWIYNTYGSGDSQKNYGSYLNMSERGCGPVALADAYNRRNGGISSKGLASKMYASGAYSPNKGTSVEGFVHTSQALGMPTKVGGVTTSSLRHATPNNPITVVGSGQEFGTHTGNNHFMNVVGSDKYGNAYVSNPLTGKVSRKPISSVASSSLLGIYGSGDGDMMDNLSTFAWPDSIVDALEMLKEETAKILGIFNFEDSTADKVQKKLNESQNEEALRQAKQALGDDEFNRLSAEAESLARSDYAKSHPKTDVETEEQYERKFQRWYATNSSTYLAKVGLYDQAASATGDMYGNLNQSMTEYADNLTGDNSIYRNAASNIQSATDAATQYYSSYQDALLSSRTSSGSGSGNGGASAVQSAAEVFEAMVSQNQGVTYNQNGYTVSYTTRSGNNITSRPDCSGMMSATILNMGYGLSTGSSFIANPTTQGYQNQGNVLVTNSDGSLSSDWEIMPFDANDQRPGDIYVSSGHTEMFVKKINGGDYGFNAGGTDPIYNSYDKAVEYLSKSGTVEERYGDTSNVPISTGVNGNAVIRYVKQLTGDDIAGSDTSEKVWNYLRYLGLSPETTAGIMGNLQAESAMRPNNLQDTYERSLGSDDYYTEAVDNGSYTNFSGDNAGYGLMQWTSSDRKANLYNALKSQDLSIADLRGQLDFLYNENIDHINAMEGMGNIYDASTHWLRKVEIPADSSDDVAQYRANAGQAFYNLYKNNAVLTDTEIFNKDYVQSASAGSYPAQDYYELRSKIIGDEAYDNNVNQNSAALIDFGLAAIPGSGVTILDVDACTPSQKSKDQDSEKSSQAIPSTASGYTGIGPTTDIIQNSNKSYMEKLKSDDVYESMFNISDINKMTDDERKILFGRLGSLYSQYVKSTPYGKIDKRIRKYVTYEDQYPGVYDKIYYLDSAIGWRNQYGDSQSAYGSADEFVSMLQGLKAMVPNIKAGGDVPSSDWLSSMGINMNGENPYINTDYEVPPIDEYKFTDMTEDISGQQQADTIAQLTKISSDLANNTSISRVDSTSLNEEQLNLLLNATFSVKSEKIENMLFEILMMMKNNPLGNGKGKTSENSTQNLFDEKIPSPITKLSKG